MDGVCAPLLCHQSGQGASSQHKPGGKQARVQLGTCQDDFLVPAIHPTTREFRQFDGNHRSSPRSLFLHLPHAMGYRHSRGGDKRPHPTSGTTIDTRIASVQPLQASPRAGVGGLGSTPKMSSPWLRIAIIPGAVQAPALPGQHSRASKCY